MRRSTTRCVCILLTAIMCIGLLVGLVTPASAATVTYKYGSYSGYSKVILNWGQRGVDATFLSPNAEAFYEDNAITYDDLSVMSGATNTSSVPSSALYKELQELMASNHTKQTNYGDTRYLYCFTDCQNNNDSAGISAFYSGRTVGPDWDGGTTWNREHTWPKSKTTAGTANNSSRGEVGDIIMLRPAVSNINSSRGNKAYGESAGYYDPNSVSNGAYNIRGDAARTLLYVYVRWGNTSYMWGSAGVMENKDVLLRWIEEDPVDTWELARNDSVESITGTRNVFVDYPELAFLLFNEEIPEDMTTPSGKAADSNSGVINDGWKLENGKWVYYENGVKVKNAWRKDSAGLCYLNADGILVTNRWVRDGADWRYVDRDGHSVTNKWVRDSVGLCYLNGEGKLATNCWVQEGAAWRYVDGEGHSVTNKWVRDSAGLCYLNNDGKLVTNRWVRDGATWRYVDRDGHSVTNKWVRDSVTWCYLDSEGKLATNTWQRDSAGLCYLDGAGHLVTNRWVRDGKNWRYVDRDGHSVTNTWQRDSSGWCYLDSEGYAVTGTKVIDGKEYHFNSNGVCTNR